MTRHITLTLVALIALSSGLPNAQASRLDDSIWVGSYGGISSWQPVARDELILWASPSRPYLVKIWPSHRSLRFAHTLGVTNTAGRITDFDQIIVDGRRIPIKSIHRIDRQQAKSMRYRKS